MSRSGQSAYFFLSSANRFFSASSSSFYSSSDLSGSSSFSSLDPNLQERESSIHGALPRDTIVAYHSKKREERHSLLEQSEEVSAEK
jgi:hypothetical protein